jgi:hypothetical protein
MKVTDKTADSRQLLDAIQSLNDSLMWMRNRIEQLEAKVIGYEEAYPIQYRTLFTDDGGRRIQAYKG